MIPPSFIQDLLSRVDIVEVVGRQVQLKKAGINHKGLCPFHGEKSPSFIVSPARQTYHCFGCGVHGNAVGFLMENSGMGFIDAVKDLAQQAGMTVPEEEISPQDRERAAAAKARQVTLSDVLSKANDHYRKQLKATPRAIDYLKGRGLSGEVAARFGIGYAPEGWRTLASVFGQYDDPLLEESGLVIVHEAESGDEADRKRYDRFRDRIMFPIRSVQGDVIGFGGRVLDKGEPKYLNSPETPVFSKGRELYGLHEAKGALRHRGYVLVVEGYMDVVALAQAGFENAVATLGTACTAEHVHKLFRFTDSVVFSFDGDAAGRRAAGRALEASLPHATDTRNVRFLFLPPEHDPDSYVRQLGTEAFERCIEQAVPLSRQLIEAARDGCDLTAAEGRARFLSNAKPLWSALPEGALRRQLLAELAQMGALALSDLNELWQTSTTARARPRGELEPGAGERTTRPSATRGGSTTRRREAPMAPADQALRMLLLHNDWWGELSADDHELLHQLPAPHGELCAWLERQLAEHGAQPWAALEQGLIVDGWQDQLRRLIPALALDDEMSVRDLHRMLDGMWIERLALEQKQLIEQASVDPSALHRWREVEAKRQARLSRMRESREAP